MNQLIQDNEISSFKIYCRSRLDWQKALRFGIVIVFLWIGDLKFFTYEANCIVPFLANTPFMSFF
ncbi:MULTISPECIES: DUF417 family protein [unclassified Mucilaginibacter]|uniref:DUF417 family protein n=1 Tax=unclassified Mucilaginibacter TaxID=2617802 RepID=UPI003395B36B